jgi:hypothetical protein
MAGGSGQAADLPVAQAVADQGEEPAGGCGLGAMSRASLPRRAMRSTARANRHGRVDTVRGRHPGRLGGDTLARKRSHIVTEPDQVRSAARVNAHQQDSWAQITLASHGRPRGTVSRQTGPEVSSLGRTGGKVIFSRLLSKVAWRVGRCLESSFRDSEDAK